MAYDQGDERIDMDEVARIARENKPKLIIAGGTAYSRIWDFPRFREIADEVGAYLMVDMSRFSGLVASGEHPRLPACPCGHQHHAQEPARPRSGIILTNEEDLAKKFNSAVFPGMQGGR